MKRNMSKLQEEESRLSSLLFNKSDNFIKKLSRQDKGEGELNLKPAWIDDDDSELCTNISTKKSKKTEIYSQKLKQKYETLMGTPSWAKVTKKIKSENDSDSIVRTVGHLQKNKTRGLKKDVLELKEFPKVNSETGNEGPIITCIDFHPKISAAMVAGQAGVVSLFSIGGDVNSKLHSFKLKKFKVSTAQFTPDGSEAYISSKLSHEYCVYNLVKAEPTQIQLPKIVKKPKIFKMSPNGKYMATAEGFDEVYLICVQSRELLRSLKHNTNVESVLFSHDSEQLYCYGVEGQITLWDLSTFRAIKKFYDHGCVSASCLSMSPCGRLLATGSGEGIVNIYETANLATTEPLPVKTISNLTTKITNVKFNATSEILSISSSYYPNAVKLVHIPSYHIFNNFPKQNNLCQVETVTFSPNSGYMAVGNNKGCAYLYRLKHYKNY
ncbi:U3 small nucleolar RNA-associated protein 18 homolog [Epargyreus clarus]|uniref:U3 small nucleolar RNA-associated protein 18 homolog n=1 Tax=Epargyreus clarus TaxID=520877 RepID=UPI003C2E018D